MNRIEFKKTKFLAKLMTSLAMPANDFQISVQFPGQSLDPEWPNEEIIVATGGLAMLSLSDLTLLKLAVPKRLVRTLSTAP